MDLCVSRESLLEITSPPPPKLCVFRWVPVPVPDEQAFKAIKDGVDAAHGAKIYLNSGTEFVLVLLFFGE